MLSREIFLEALTQLSVELGRHGVLGELSILGGTAMVLAFNARSSTKDVDAIFEPSAAIRDAAAIVAGSLNLSADWLNDAAQGYISPSGDFAEWKAIELSNLRVQTPTPEYMLAMKVLAARTGVGEERGDAKDIAFLIRLLGLKEPSEVMDIVSRYYDPSRILPRSTYLVDEIFEKLNS